MSLLCLLAHVVFDGQFLSIFYEEKFVFIGTFVPLYITSSSSLALFLVFHLLLAFRKLIMMCLCAVSFIVLVLGVHWASWVGGLIVIKFGIFLQIFLPPSFPHHLLQIAHILVYPRLSHSSVMLYSLCKTSFFPSIFYFGQFLLLNLQVY